VEYDEDHELTRYVWNHYQRLMMDFERRIGRAIIARAKAATSRSSQLQATVNRVWGAVDDPEVSTALAHGPEAFRRRVRERLLSERGAEVFINRCPSCERVARTPRAHQCSWCGLDWHG
jgi:hypothetical protein